MQGPEPSRVQAENRQYRLILEVIDLVGLHVRIDQLVPDLARCLLKAVSFDAMAVLLPRKGGTGADCYTAEAVSLHDPPSATRLDIFAVPQLRSGAVDGAVGEEEPAHCAFPRG